MTITFDDFGDDHLVASSDYRHDISGYRVARYTLFANEWVWDESYLFYQSLDDIKEAYTSKNYAAGRASF